MKIFLTYLLWIPQLVLILISFIVVPIMLHFGWEGTSTVFGNELYGKYGNKNNRTVTRFDEWRFLCITNPVSNFGKNIMNVIIREPVFVEGNPDITDGSPGITGKYIARSGWKWEVRIVKRTFPGKCFEGRWGWKLNGKQFGESATFVCRANPFKKFG